LVNPNQLRGQQSGNLCHAIAWSQCIGDQHRELQYDEVLPTPSLVSFLVVNEADRGHTGNHTGYKQVKGTKVTAEQIQDLYAGLKQSYLDDFDMMLSGYLPSPEAIQAVGSIGRELQHRTRNRPGAFFWGPLPPPKIDKS
jgi:hypothetical protein